MSIHIDNLARIIRDSVDDADATREEWEAALDQVFIEPDYILCAGHTEEGVPCPFFVEVNSNHELDGDNIAPWIHLTRGDEADESLDDHEAVPGEVHPLSYWREHGPERVKERFVN